MEVSGRKFLSDSSPTKDDKNSTGENKNAHTLFPRFTQAPCWGFARNPLHLVSQRGPVMKSRFINHIRLETNGHVVARLDISEIAAALERLPQCEQAGLVKSIVGAVYSYVEGTATDEQIALLALFLPSGKE